MRSIESYISEMEKWLNQFINFVVSHPLVGTWYTGIARFLFPILALMILSRAIRSLLKVPHAPELWAQLNMPNGGSVMLSRWENIIGRSTFADVVVNYPTISRQHAALIRDENEVWQVHDLDSKGGTAVNGKPVKGSTQVKVGDTISLGGVPLVLLPLTLEEEELQQSRRQKEKPSSLWPSFFWLTIFQVLACLQLIITSTDTVTLTVPLVFLAFTLIMWIYYAALRVSRCVGFEMETIAFFLSTLSLSITASSAPKSLLKQFIAVILGLLLFLILGIFLRNLDRIKKIRWQMAACAIGLLAITVILGQVKNGAANWISLGSFSFQPSELAKICYIFAGSATLDRLFRRRNIRLFILLTGICILCLALMGDFGTAAIFFVTFVVISYLRSGDFATISLICGGAVFAGFLLLKFKPYISNRFAAWGHVWEYTSTTGYQQTRTMSAAASGGLFGLGSGEGWLRYISAANTDLVFGMLCEEWGLIIAVLAVLAIITLAIFAVRACRVGRSSYYTIAACAASALFVFQTSLNVFGSVDILPLTGVTFPFVSNGGSSMMSAWGLLAFLKATDTRENASFAIRRFAPKRTRKEAMPYEKN